MNQWQNNNPQQEENEIDIFRLLQILWKRAWMIVLFTAICGICAYLYSALLITPTYRSYFTAYVNNRVENYEGNGSTSTSDLNASIGLTYLYQDIIVSRTVLTDAAEQCGLDYNYKRLKSMVSTAASDDSALISVYVVDTDPVLATRLAAAIAAVAPAHVERMRDGSSMRILDEPVQPESKYEPSNTKNAALGAAIGFVLIVAVVLVMDLLNDKVRDADELERRHNLVVIGVIPELGAVDNAGSYGYQAKGSETK